jgi:putative ABC transport system permease protein
MLGAILPSTLIVVVLLSLLAGSYPAFFLSSFRPTEVLKGKLQANTKGGGLRSTLVVVQFSVSMFLIVGTLVIYNQLHYIQNRDLGFNRQQVLVVNNVNSISNAVSLKQQIKQLRAVSNATLTSFTPTSDSRWPKSLSTQKNISCQIEFWPVDEDYLNTMEMKLVTGRNFSRELLTDSSSMIINQTAANLLGIAKEPIGQLLYDNDKIYTIIGVVEDFNFNSLRKNISPVALSLKRINGKI